MSLPSKQKPRNRNNLSNAEAFSCNSSVFPANVQSELNPGCHLGHSQVLGDFLQT